MTAAELEEKNPFLGLRPFQESETSRFFGREKQIRELVQKLEESSFIAVTGTSGCGKSSLVRAGVLGALSNEEDTLWRPVVLKPGNHPIANLAEQLSKVLVASGGADAEFRADSLAGRLRLGGMGLVEVVRVSRPDPRERILVIVDQFEEVFRFKEIADPEEASAFVKLLLAAAGARESPVSVVITLRSDSLGRCEDFQGLPEAINNGQYLVPKLTREQRKDAIIKPIEMAGHQIAPRLVQRLLNDVTDNFDDLPVMQHVLYRTWWHWAKAGDGTRVIDIDDYEAVGTAEKALSQHADEACGSLAEFKPLIQKVFRALTQRVDGGTDIRRPLDFERLCKVVGEERDKVEKVVLRFGRQDTGFLSLPAETDLAKNPVVDISHESLIRIWESLRKWVKVEAEAKEELLRLVVAAENYAREEGELKAGRDLAYALDWEKNNRPNESWVALYCVGNGKEKWDSVDRYLRKSEIAKWKTWINTFLAFAGCLAITVILLQYFNYKSLLSKEMSSRAWNSLNLDPARSAQLALKALALDGKNTNAERVLRQSLADLEIAHTEKIISLGSPIADARFNSDTTKLVIASGNTVHIFQGPGFHDTLGTFTRSSPLKRAWLLPGDTLLLTWTQNNIAQLQPVSGGASDSLTCQEKGDFIYTMAVSGNDIATGCYYGGVSRWHLQGNRIGEREAFNPGGKQMKATITALGFSFDGGYLASGDAEGNIAIWKSGQKEAWIVIPSDRSKAIPVNHADAIRDLCFSPYNSSVVASASDDSRAIVWRLELKKRCLANSSYDRPSRWVMRHEDPVTAVRFYDSNTPLLTISSKRVNLWASEDSKKSNEVEDWVTEAGLSADGKMAITGCNNGSATLWSTQSLSKIAMLRGHKNTVSHVFFGKAGQVVTAGDDGDVRIWRLEIPEVKFFSEKWVIGAAFDPSGKKAAFCAKRDGLIANCRIIDPFDTENTPLTPLASVGTDQVGFLTWSRNGKLLAGWGEYLGINKNNKPVFWNIETGERLVRNWMKGYRMAFFSPGTDELVAVGLDGDISILDAATLATENPRNTLPKLRRCGPSPSGLAGMSPDGRWIAAVIGQNIALYNRADTNGSDSLPCRRILTGHRGDIVSLEFSPDSRSLVTASLDGTARIWQMDPGQRPGNLELAGGHMGGVYCAAFNREGRWVATSGSDGAICVWDAQGGQILATLHRHSQGVNEVSFGPGGEILSASDDGTVALGRCDACGKSLRQLRHDAVGLAMTSPEDSL